MSIQLPTIDFTGLSVGATGKVQIPQPKVQVGELGHLRLYNESGAGLDIVFSNGHGETVPAGAWPMFEIEPETQTFTWMITYVLPNAPVATMKMVYYFPYEGVPPTPALGNSPIGITGGVSTSSVQTLSNENNPANQLVIDVGDTGNVNLYTLYTDGHALWKVDASGVLHQVFKVNTAANFLQLGQAGDITEVLGALKVDQGLEIVGAVTADVTELITGVLTAPGANILGAIGVLTHILGTLTVDQASTLTGVVTAPAANILGTAGNLQHILGTLTVDQAVTLASTVLTSGLLTASGQITGAAAQKLILNAVTGQNIEFDINNVAVGHIDAGGLGFSSKKLFDQSANNLADWSATGLFLKGNPAAQGKFQYQGNGSNTDWTFSANHGGSFTSVNGTTTVTHGLTQFGAAATPDTVLINDTSGGSMTADASSINTTTFVCAAGQAHAATFWAFKF